MLLLGGGGAATPGSTEWRVHLLETAARSSKGWAAARTQLQLCCSLVADMRIPALGDALKVRALSDAAAP